MIYLDTFHLVAMCIQIYVTDASAHSDVISGRWRRKVVGRTARDTVPVLEKMQRDVRPTEPSLELPSFYPSVDTEVEEYRGQPAYLHCKVANQAHHEVTWLRHEDSHLLYVGTKPFTNDQRFYVSHRVEDDNDWCLTIKDAQPSDSGIYECQLSTTPAQRLEIKLKIVARNVSVAVDVQYAAKEHSASISGTEMVSSGSTIQVRCKIKKYRWNDKEPQYARWTKNKNILNVNEPHSRFSTSVERINGTTIHTLNVENANVEDTGEYGCTAQSTPVKALFVHVNAAPTLSVSLLLTTSSPPKSTETAPSFGCPQTLLNTSFGGLQVLFFCIMHSYLTM